MASAKTTYQNAQRPRTPDPVTTPEIIGDGLSKSWSRNAPVCVDETLVERRARVEAVRAKYAHLSGAHTDEFLEEKLQKVPARG